MFVETSEPLVTLFATLARLEPRIDDFKGGCGDPPADVLPDMRGIFVGASLLPSVAPFTAAATVAPSLEPTVLTDGEPAIVGSCCLVLRNDTSEALGKTAPGRLGVLVAEPVGAKEDFLLGGVDGTLDL